MRKICEHFTIKIEFQRYGEKGKEGHHERADA